MRRPNVRWISPRVFLYHVFTSFAVQAPALANIWKQRVKVHIEARTGAMRVELSGSDDILQFVWTNSLVGNSPPHRSRDRSERPVGEDAGGPDWGAPPDADMGFAGDFGGGSL